jgi:hypothetical protein
MGKVRGKDYAAVKGNRPNPLLRAGTGSLFSYSMSMSNLSAPTAGLNDFLGGNLTNFVNIGE